MMFALRNLTRSAPRSAARLSTQVARPQPLIRQVAAFQPSWTQAAPRLTASFHMSTARKSDAAVAEELVAKLRSEIELEQEMKEDEDLSANIKEYLENSPFEIEDKPGREEVVLTRTFGDEKIRVVFTTADLEGNAEENDMYGENAVDDVDDGMLDGQSGGANTKGAINQGRTQDGNIRVAPEDRVAPADREELDDEYMDGDGQEQGFPSKVHIRIERPGKGALEVEAAAQDGDIIVQEFWYLQDPSLAAPQSAEKVWERRGAYAGPPFTTLDEDLQILIEKYLEERGINTRLALFIPDYIDHKEQKEYVRWLNNVKSFIE